MLSMMNQLDAFKDIHISTAKPFLCMCITHVTIAKFQTFPFSMMYRPKQYIYIYIYIYMYVYIGGGGGLYKTELYIVQYYLHGVYFLSNKFHGSPGFMDQFNGKWRTCHDSLNVMQSCRFVIESWKATALCCVLIKYWSTWKHISVSKRITNLVFIECLFWGTICEWTATFNGSHNSGHRCRHIHVVYCICIPHR